MKVHEVEDRLTEGSQSIPVGMIVRGRVFSFRPRNFMKIHLNFSLKEISMLITTLSALFSSQKRSFMTREACALMKKAWDDGLRSTSKTEEKRIISLANESGLSVDQVKVIRI